MEVPLILTLIFVRPGVNPVTSPSSETEAISGFEDVHSIVFLDDLLG